ncbi:fetuin-B [Centrocercus urophasianus]|uniref:fetuin-B n=1 Tax=Centrocercus urophasianus TaxID=9002 RepID=UPI001C647298|nr:fetuin-B [Centrocercus urophasianus]
MLLLISVLFGTQALCSWAASPPAGELPSVLLSPTCHDAAVEEAADLALRHINADRTEGYILSLYRILSVREHPQEITGSVFYLILDVVDTECHVLSRQLWKNCRVRPAHTTVYGQCKAIIYINQPRKIAHLNTYECNLQPVPSRYIWEVCPDCPVDDCPTEPKYLETAVKSLAKFNEKSEQTHYFSVLNVTRASMQWVTGPAHFVEFVIQETSCPRREPVADISKCKPLSPELAQTGFCKGSVVNSDMERKETVTISCEIYSPQNPATEEGKLQTNQGSEESSQNHQQAFPAETNPFSLHLGKTMGCVKILPPSTEDISFHKVRESQNEQEDRKPVPPKATECMSTPPAPHGETTHADKPATGPVILPFPTELSLSDSCPGEAKQIDSILHPLLTGKPAKV